MRRQLRSCVMVAQCRIDYRVQARLDQEKEVVHIQSVQPRGFSTEQWQELATKLSVWQTNVHQVLSSLHEVQARLRIDETSTYPPSVRNIMYSLSCSNSS